MRTNGFFAAHRRDDDERRENVLALNGTQSAPVPPEISEAMRRAGGDPFQGAVVRHVIGDDALTSDMEVEAARRALHASGTSPSEVDVLMVHSLTPDLLYPSNAPAVQDKCGLTRASAWAFDAGCASSVLGLDMAAGLVRGGVARRVLLVCSGAPSRTVAPSDPAAPIFGDGAAALVIGEVPAGRGLLGAYQRTDGAFRDAATTLVVAHGRPERAWFKHEGAIRYASLDPARGRESGVRQIEFCREACEHALERAGLSLDDVALFTGAQTVGWQPDVLCRGVGLPVERCFETFAEVGNLGAVTMPFNVERALATGRVQRGDVVLAYTPGAGFTSAAAVLRL